MRVVLISCSSKKLESPARARDFYSSPLFRMSLKIGEMINPDNIFILSAKHGLVELDRVIAPYNETLNKMSQLEVEKWAERVLVGLKERGYDLKRDQFIFLAGRKYRKYLIPHISNYEIPMNGLGIGQQLKFLKERISE